MNKIVIFILIESVTLILLFIVNYILIKFIKTHEKGELIAERMTFWGTFLGFISIGSASGINLSGNDVLVVTIANGGLFSIAMLFIGHHIRVITLQDRIYQNRNNIT